jgi:ribosomal protein L7/L12
MNTSFLYAAIIIMIIIIANDYIKKKYNINLDNIDLSNVENFAKTEIGLNRNKFAVNKNTGKRNLVLINSGDNKATVMATLRQITGLDYNAAKILIETVPTTIMANISDREAILNKKALEFVGAKCEIR